MLQFFNKIWRRLFNNPQLKILALVIAIATWYYANSRLKEEITVRVPLNIDVPDGYELVYQSHDRVQVRITGSHYLVERRQEESRQKYLTMSVRLDKKDITEGLTRLEVKTEWLNIPEPERVQLSLDKIEPGTVEIYVSRIMERPMPVGVRLFGEPRLGHEIGEYSSIPKKVNVKGPAVVLDKMDEIVTQEVSVWDAKNNLRRMVPLRKQKTVDLGEGREVSVSLSSEPAQVAVKVEILAKKAKRKVKEIPVELLLPPDFPYEPIIPKEESTISVTVEGSPQKVEGIGVGDFHAYVSLRGLEEEEIASGSSAPYKQGVNVRLKPDLPVSVISQEPEQITVVLKNPD